MAPPKFPVMLILAAVAVMTVAAGVADAQNTSCAASLGPCAAYLNGTGKPPQPCCDAMAAAVEKEMSCLCTLYATPSMLAAFGVTVAQAMALPSRCDIVSGSCSTAPAPAPTLAMTPASTSTPALTPASTPASTPSSPAQNKNSGVGRITWAGLPSLLLLWASMMLY